MRPATGRPLFTRTSTTHALPYCTSTAFRYCTLLRTADRSARAGGKRLEGWETVSAATDFRAHGTAAPRHRVPRVASVPRRRLRTNTYPTQKQCFALSSDLNYCKPSPPDAQRSKLGPSVFPPSSLRACDDLSTQLDRVFLGSRTRTYSALARGQRTCPVAGRQVAIVL